MPWFQIDLRLAPRRRGFHLITPEVEAAFREMPAHVKCSMIGSSLTIPIAAGQLRLGTWQGIYLCEHRDRGGPRRLVITAHGDL
jgi:thiamine phosphate synthase YjbQ (UPF0047 family)